MIEDSRIGVLGGIVLIDGMRYRYEGARSDIIWGSGRRGRWLDGNILEDVAKRGGFVVETKGFEIAGFEDGAGAEYTLGIEDEGRGGFIWWGRRKSEGINFFADGLKQALGGENVEYDPGN